MTPQQRAAVDDVLSMIEDAVHVFEATFGADDVLILHDSDTQIVSVDVSGHLSSGFIVPAAPAMTPGWDSGWEPGDE